MALSWSNAAPMAASAAAQTWSAALARSMVGVPLEASKREETSLLRAVWLQVKSAAARKGSEQHQALWLNCPNSP